MDIDGFLGLWEGGYGVFVLSLKPIVKSSVPTCSQTLGNITGGAISTADFQTSQTKAVGS